MIDGIITILKAFADSNLFNEGIVLIGSWCFWVYQKSLGAKKFPLRTQDIDFLIPNPYKGLESEGLVNKLQGLGFERAFHSDGSTYLWNEEFKIEFITPEKGRGADGPIKIRQLGIRAIPLRFVSLLLDKPIKLDISGVEILVPNPGNFCLHKLLIAARRRKIEKSHKDLEQAICTSVIVSTREIRMLFNALPVKWRKAIVRVLEKAGDELPLYLKEIKILQVTLQNADRETL
jgi:hypothetical protein